MEEDDCNDAVEEDSDFGRDVMESDFGAEEKDLGLEENCFGFAEKDLNGNGTR